MKKYFAILVAVIFVFGVAGAGLAQTGKQDAPAKPIEGKKTEKSEKRQAVTPEKKDAAKAPAAAEGQAKPDTKPVKKSEKSKKRQAPTPEKKKAAEAPPVGEGQAAPAAPAKK
ncbi:MAG: hypothetical protein ACM34C_07550 [Syntrophaceae bacterium]